MLGATRMADDGQRTRRRARASGIFVVQKHQARRLHYDFRLEMDGVLRSWAVPKGPSMNPREPRLAVEVEDHPLEYADFEGRIAEGKYGGGAVIVWDRGRYTMVDPPRDASAGVRRGGFEFELHGRKLRGSFVLIRTRARPGSRRDARAQWLLIKRRDRYATEADVFARKARSVISNRTLESLLRGAKAPPTAPERK
jgi:bifunctional non-homologous end joining protein LigD